MCALSAAASVDDAHYIGNPGPAGHRPNLARREPGRDANSGDEQRIPGDATKAQGR
jgi:hypothetical protein